MYTSYPVTFVILFHDNFTSVLFTGSDFRPVTLDTVAAKDCVPNIASTTMINNKSLL